MNDGAYKVTVAKDLEDLIPIFMKNRKKELDNAAHGARGRRISSSSASSATA